ncbi:MAG: lytic transglycosylase domain-containing protein, partial [Alphaproteobacteria bacterium]
AANFWAARGLLVTRKPEHVTHYLNGAARHARTFYGLLAARILGQEVAYEWSSPPVVADAVGRIVDAPRGRRAMALVQAGQDLGAERELRNLARISDKNQALAILALADAGGMAGLAVRLSDRLFPDGGGFDGAAYPVPAWLPSGGFTVDRALVYAVIRQESKFNPKAKSWAGARGLMQLMPRTASFVARDSSLHRHRLPKLYDPDLNLKLGQKYIGMLLAEPHIQGDLLLLAAAWNGGPGNLNKWRRRIEYTNDPLLFIETIPAFETRHFVERVLANLWIYRDRLGQDKPSLDALAAGQWPVYKALGHGKVEVAIFDEPTDGISAR